MFIPIVLFAQTGTIKGRVYNSFNNQPVPFANVLVVGSTTGTTSDENGKYFILDVPVGTHSVRVDYIGYKSVTVKNVNISENLTTNLDF